MFQSYSSTAHVQLLRDLQNLSIATKVECQAPSTSTDTSYLYPSLPHWYRTLTNVVSFALTMHIKREFTPGKG